MTKNLMRAFFCFWLVVFAMQAQAARTCDISALPVAFGAYRPLDPTSLDSDSGSIQLTCTDDAPSITISYNLVISPSISGGINPRVMKSGSRNLSYNLFTASNYAVIWGDGVSGTAAVGGSFAAGGGVPRVGTRHIIYGRIAAKQFVPAGTYIDSLSVTVTF